MIMELVVILKVEQLPSKNILDYSVYYSDNYLEEIISRAEKLRSYTYTHVNSTSIGGGVAEILYSLVPLMNSVGLKTVWEVIRGSDEFFRVTKKIHNALQGAEIDLTSYDKKIYLEINERNAREELELGTDNIIIHDPQPLPLRMFRDHGRRWVWRCHIDLSSPYRPVWEFIASLLRGYDASVFHLKEYIHPETPTPIKYVMPPSIDPLSPKNIELPWERVIRILERYDIDPERPILLQVARFDPWKDPFAAIDTYRLVKKEIPGTQLLLVTAMATDDPEGWEYYEKTARYAGLDEDIHLLTNLKGVGHIEVNAFQRASTVVLQLSRREGFGLAVTEALWKMKPVIVRPRGGLKLQVINGVNGFYAETPEEAAEKAVYLIKHPEIREKMGVAGRKLVLENFTIIKHLERYIELFEKLRRGNYYS